MRPATGAGRTGASFALHKKVRFTGQSFAEVSCFRFVKFILRGTKNFSFGLTKVIFFIYICCILINYQPFFFLVFRCTNGS